MNLLDFDAAVDGGDVQDRDQPVGTQVLGVHQHLWATGAEHLKPQRFEHSNLGRVAGELGMGVARGHALQQCPGDTPAAVTLGDG